MSVGDTTTAVTMASSGCAWTDATVSPAPSATDGTFRVLLDNSDTALLTPGWYRLEVKITSGSEPQTCFECMLEVLPAANATAAPSTYNTYAQTLDRCPWIGNIVPKNQGIQSDLGEWRGEARRWFNRQIMARVRQKLDDFCEGHLVNLEAVDDEEPDWLDLTYSEGENTYDEILTLVRGFLDDDYVASTDPGLVDYDGQVAEICAYYTAYLASRHQIGKEGETTYQKFAIGCLGTAHNRLAGYVAKIYSDDTDAPYIYLRP